MLHVLKLPFIKHNDKCHAIIIATFIFVTVVLINILIMLNTVRQGERLGYEHVFQKEWDRDTNYILHGSSSSSSSSSSDINNMYASSSYHNKWGNLTKDQLLKVVNVTGFDHIFIAVCRHGHTYDEEPWLIHHHVINYMNDWKKICQDRDHDIISNRDYTYSLLKFGDCSRCFGSMRDHNIPVFQKTRTILKDKTNPILIPLNTMRHWKHTKMRYWNYIPWNKKQNAITWRGTTTGNGTRYKYVKALADLGHDVKFDHAVQKHQDWLQNGLYKGERMSRRGLMKYKYVLSIEGNDVASNLKWLMSHNSLVIMPTPTYESWLMEGRLEPYVHYVPLDDPRDIDNLMIWLRTHDDQCQQIVRNANDWMKRFDDVQRTKYINRKTLRLMNDWLNRQFQMHHLFPETFSSISVTTFSETNN